ncbi:MAG: glycosyltransferase family 4 protein [Bacteroidota bacterium]
MSKILLAVTDISRIGGMASHLYTVSSELRNRGWEVHCVATNTRGDYFDEMSKVNACYDLSSVSLSPKKVFMAADLANSILPDVILANNCALMQYAFPLVNPSVKPISVLHSDDPRFYAIAALFPERVFRWISPAAGVAERFHRFIDEHLHGRIRVIPHGVNRGQFFPKGAKLDPAPFRILFVGFLGESKGADLLPDIFEKIATAIPDALLTIVGDGPLRRSLQAEFEKRGLHNKILFCGTTSTDQTAELMRTSHVLLLPTNIEGFGIVIVEAMMCGVVPVVSRLNGITDQLVQQDKTGLLVSPKDVNGFAEAVKKIHDDNNLYQTMSINARKMASERFSHERMADRYESLFTEPDDRNRKGKKSLPGWYMETAVQFLRKRMR